MRFFGVISFDFMSIKEIKANLDQLNETYLKTKGYANADDPSAKEDMMYQIMNNLRNFIYSVEAEMYNYQREHQVGHLPVIQGAGKMQHCLEVLGLDDDYDIQRPAIFAKSSNKRGEIEVTYIKK